MREYEINGKRFQYTPGTEPASAVPVASNAMKTKPEQPLNKTATVKVKQTARK